MSRMTEGAPSARLPRGPLLAALIAALPAFAVPFLSDDWANMRTGASAILGRTPYGDFRPLSQATFVIDRAVWGTWAMPWHLTNVVFVVAATALLTALVQRHLRDRALAGLAGLLFALHPYHVSNVAWISARSDLLCAAFLFASLLAYDRWRQRPHRVPWAALLLFEAALLSQTTAVVLPLVAAAIGWARDRRPPRRAEVARGLLPLGALAVLHLACLRPLALGWSRPLMPAWFGPGALDNLVRYAAAAVVPVPAEHFSGGPSLLAGFGAVGAVAMAAGALTLAFLAASARANSGRVPAAVSVAGALFVLLSLPSLLRFEPWSLLIPGAASSLLLATLLKAAGRRTALGAGAFLALVWGAASVDHWISWRAASRASAALVADLAEASRRPGVERLVVANLPRRVRGMPVGLEFSAAIEASGGRPVPVEYVTYLDYPRAFDDDLDAPPDESIHRTPEGIVIGLLVPEGVHSRNLDPGPADPDVTIAVRHGVIRFLEPNHMRLTLPPTAPGTARFVWQRGRLVALDPPPDRESGPGGMIPPG